jgi:hypothetical protein
VRAAKVALQVLSHDTETSRQNTYQLGNDGRRGATKGEAILNGPVAEVNVKVVKSLTDARFCS